MQKQTGFTIVELIIVIALLAVMAAVGIPNYLNWLPDIRLKSVARNLKSDLMLAQQRAIRENGNVAILFNPGGDRYTVFLDNSTTPPNGLIDPSEETLKTEMMPDHVTMDVAAFGAGLLQRVRFDGRGLPDESGEVRISNTKNIIRRIGLSLTGRAIIQISSDGGGTWSDGE